MKKRYIIVPILIGTMAISSYTILKVKHLENENSNLKNELRNKQKTKTEYKVSVDDIKEINKKNADLIIYETDYTNYNLESKDSTFLVGIDAKMTTKFKYKVGIDLSKSEISESNGEITVTVDSNNIQLKEIIVSRPKLTYDTNFVSAMRGNRIIDIEAELIHKSYDDIEEIIHEEFSTNKEIFKMNLSDKLKTIYKLDNVNIVIK